MAVVFMSVARADDILVMVSMDIYLVSLYTSGVTGVHLPAVSKGSTWCPLMPVVSRVYVVSRV